MKKLIHSPTPAAARMIWLRPRQAGRVFLTDGVHASIMRRAMAILPEDDAPRLYRNPNFPSFRIVHRGGGDAAVRTLEIYGVPIISFWDTRAESESAIRAAYAAARASTPLASAGGFDIYADGGKLTCIKEDCGEKDARG